MCVTYTYSYVKAWEARSQTQVSSLVVLQHNFFKNGDSHWAQSSPMGLGRFLVSSKVMLVSDFPQHRYYGYAQFYVSAKVLNSAPHIFTTNTLPTEPSFQTWALVLLTLYNTFDLCQSWSIYPLFTLIDFPLSGHKESFHSPTGGLLVCVQFQITVHRMKKIFSMDISFHEIIIKYIGVGLLGIPSIY